MLFDLPPPPAIIHPSKPIEIKFGLSYAVSRVEYDRFRLPADRQYATLGDLIPWLPSDLRQMPGWALQSMLMMNQLIGFGVGGVSSRSFTFLTSTSGSNQTHTLVADWNSSDNSVECISHSSKGYLDVDPGCGALEQAGYGGGGGGYAKAVNVSKTGGSTQTFRLQVANSSANDVSATWWGNTALATSSAGIRGTNVQAGATTTNAIGSVKFAGGSGAANVPSGAGGGGGGAAGPSGAGGNGSGSTGGTGNAGNTPANTAGTTFDATHGSGGGGTGSVNSVTNGTAGKNYGGGGGGSSATVVNTAGNGTSGLIVLTNNAST